MVNPVPQVVEIDLIRGGALETRDQLSQWFPLLPGKNFGFLAPDPNPQVVEGVLDGALLSAGLQHRFCIRYLAPVRNFSDPKQPQKIRPDVGLEIMGHY